MHKLQRTVLLVDDVKEDRLLIRRALRRDLHVDYQVLEAENGAQALAYLQQQQPDCLILDYKLPDIDGLTLLKTIVEQAAPHIYPVVMLTNTQRTALVVETMHQGAHDFLPKATFTAEHLLQAIQNAIEKVALRRELEAQRNWSHLILASLSEAVIATDAQGCITFMNPVAAALTGWPCAAAAGQPLAQVFVAQDEMTHLPVADPVTQVLRTNHWGSQLSALLAQGSGRTIAIDYTVAPMQDRLGHLSGVVVTFRDITERKQMVEALRRTSQQLKLVLDASHTIAFTWEIATDQVYRFHSTVPSLAATPSHAPDTYSNVAKAIYPADQAQFRANVERVLQDPTLPYRNEFRLANRDGSISWIAEWGQIECDAQGQPQRLIGLSIDITDRKQAELDQQFLLDLDAQTRLQDDANAILAMTAERLGQYLDVAHCAFNEVEQAADQCVFLIHWRRRGALPDLTGRHTLSSMAGTEIAHTLSHGQNVIVTDIAHDPRTMPLVDHYRALHMQSMVCIPLQIKGQRLATLTVAEERPRAWHTAEITLLANVIARIWPLVVKARAETALRRQEEMLRQVTANVPGLIGYMGADEQYRFVNATFETWFQRPRQQIIGSTPRELLGAENYAKFTPYRQQALAGTTVTYESVLTYPDGITRAIWGRYHPDIAADGRVLGFYIFVMDISERKQAEDDARFLAGVAEMLRQTDTVDALLAAVTQSVGNYLQVGRCRFIEVDWTNDRAIIHRDYCRGVPSVAGEFRLSNYQPSTWGEMAAGHTLVNHDAQQDVRTAALYATVYAPKAERAYIGVPLMRNGEWQGVFSVTAPAARQWQPREIQLLEIIAERVWLAVEKLRLDAALRASEEQLRQITDNLPGLISVVNDREEYEFVNRNYQRWLGVEPSQMLGRKIEVALNDKGAYQILQPHLQRALAGEIATFENHLKTTQGNALDVMVTHVPRRDAAGRVTGCYVLAMDITARKQVEEQLRASEARFRTLANAMPQLVWTADAQGNVDYYNVRINDYAAAVQLAEGGFDWSRFVHPDDLPATFTAWQTATQRGDAYSFEHRLCMADHSWRWHLSLAMPMVFGDNQVKWYGTATDIHERKQAEAAVAARETELRVITDNIPGWISYVDSEQHYRFVNAAYEALYNRPRNAIAGQPIHTVLGEAAYAQVLPYITNALQGKFTQFEATVAYPSGLRTIWATYVPNLDDQGVVHGFYALVTDISELKRVEERLRASEERLRLALEGGGLGIWEWQTSPDKVTWSEQEYTLFGLAPDTLVTNELFASLLHPADRAEILAALEQWATQGGDYKGEYRVIHPNGQVRWLAERGIAIADAQGHPARLLGVSFDITERKAIEQTLQQFNDQLEQQVKERTAELTKRLQELDQFAYVASHDLKSPLRAIDHLAHWISDDVGALLPPKPREYLEKMRGRIVRMEKLLDDLLAYSRADRYKYTQEQVDLATVLDNIVRLVMPPEGFTIDVAAPLPVLRTQKVPLETVLRNLISNAIKHHDRSAGWVRVTLQDLGEFLEFSVQDDGPGIAPQYYERIFQVFQTLKPRDEVEGSGMGLAIVKKIVESRNGRVIVTSTPGEGATFTFTWPKGQYRLASEEVAANTNVQPERDLLYG